MRGFVFIAVLAVWVSVITASPLPRSRYSDSNNDQTIITSEDHLFNDAGFPLRVKSGFSHDLSGFASEDAGKLFNVPPPSTRDMTPMSDPFSGFFFDMQVCHDGSVSSHFEGYRKAPSPLAPYMKIELRGLERGERVIFRGDFLKNLKSNIKSMARDATGGSVNHLVSLTLRFATQRCWALETGFEEGVDDVWESHKLVKIFNKDMMKILRDQMSEVLSRVPPSDTGVVQEDHLRPLDVKNQTTTKVEYLDGHKVIINDTTYSNGDTNHGSIFHVQIVDLLPIDDGEPETDSELTPKTRTNEIDGGRGGATDKKERDREELDADDEEDEELGEEGEIDEDVEKDILKNVKPAKKIGAPATAVSSTTEGKVIKKEKDITTKDNNKEVIKSAKVESVSGDNDKAKDKVKDEKDLKDTVIEVKSSENKKEKLAPKEEVEEEALDDELERAGDDEDERDEMNEKEEEKKILKADSMHTAESRWQNEIDNRIDTYQPQPSYNYQPHYYEYKRNYNRHPDYYRDPHYKQPYQEPSYNNYPATNNLNYHIVNTPQQQPNFNSYQPTYPKNNDRFIDLSGDTKVNDYMADQQQAGLIMIDPDAEIIDINKKPIQKLQYPRYNYRKY